MTIIHKYRGKTVSPPKAVPKSKRLLPPGLLMKRFNQVRDFLQTLGFTTAEREVILRLLRFWAYYGIVYTKESQITNNPGCSKPTFWRTIRKAEEMDLIRRINRFIPRERAQISNIYLLDKLILVIARYLCERGNTSTPEWFRPLLKMEGRLFWTRIWEVPFSLCQLMATQPVSR